MSIHSRSAEIFGYTQIKERLYLIKIFLPFIMALFYCYSSLTLKALYIIDYNSSIIIIRLILISLYYFTPYLVIIIIIDIYEKIYIDPIFLKIDINLKKIIIYTFQKVALLIFFILSVTIFLNPEASYHQSISERWFILNARLFLSVVFFLLAVTGFNRYYNLKRCYSFELFKVNPQSDGFDTTKAKIYLKENLLSQKRERICRFVLPFKRDFIIDKSVSSIICLNEFKALVYVELSNYLKNLYIAKTTTKTLFIPLSLFLSYLVFNKLYSQFGFISPFEPGSIPLYYGLLYLFISIFFFFIDFFFIELEKEYLRKETQKRSDFMENYCKLLEKILDKYPYLDRTDKSSLLLFKMSFGIKERCSFIVSSINKDPKNRII